jgi:hypothetical protein
MLLDGTVPSSRLRSISFFEWIFPWIGKLVKNHAFFGLFILGGSLGSPLLWTLWYTRKKKAMPAIKAAAPGRIIAFWLILYSVCWLWLISAPDFRYGIPFLTTCMLIPLLTLTGIDGSRLSGIGRSPRTAVRRILSLSLILSTCYYLYGGYGAYRYYAKKKEQGMSWKEGWILPLKDIYYKEPDKRDSIPYKTLNRGIKLYLSDTTHRCINAGLICTNYGDSLAIEMRGPRVEDGFRPVSLSPAHLP